VAAGKIFGDLFFTIAYTFNVALQLTGVKFYIANSVAGHLALNL